METCPRTCISSAVALRLLTCAPTLVSCLSQPPQWEAFDGSIAQPDGATGTFGADATTGSPRSDGPEGAGSPANPKPDAGPAPVGQDARGLTDANSPIQIAWELVSIGPGGVPANGPSRSPALSADGRYAVFVSDASNLVVGDTNNLLDIFRFDRQTKSLVRVNVAADGGQADGRTRPSVSVTADGRFVLFVSAASNLVPGDTNGDEDVFVRDLGMGLTTRVSTTSTGGQVQGQSATGTIAAGGRYVAFTSNANGVLPGLETRVIEAYLKDLSTGALTRITPGTLSARNLWVSADGSAVAFLAAEASANEGIFHLYDSATKVMMRIARLGADTGSPVSASFSADGVHFAFDSWKDPLTDMPAPHAVYLLARSSGAPRRLSATPDNTPANGDSYGAFLSGDARFVAFSSIATNLGHGATGRLEPYVLDRQTGNIVRIPGGNGMTSVESLSADGRALAVVSTSSDLLPGDTNGMGDVFVSQPRLLP
jgi:Tol biopolymer transport system component